MRAVDREAVGLGLDLPRMMENAGTNLAWLARSLLGGDVAARRVVVLAGRGGNGGSGLAAARRLIGWGADVEIRLAEAPHALAPVPREQLEILQRMDAPIALGDRQVPPPELFIDAILGYSQRGGPRGGAAELVAATRGGRVLALDVPSGLDLERGTVAEPAVRAEATLRLPAVAPIVGDLYLADISIPAAVYRSLGIPYRTPFGRGPIVRLA
jgi:NAD(P)H-hydrate epimerase